MAALSQIKSSDWQFSTLGVGAVAEGLSDVRQCIDLALRTTPGTDPLRPQFGSNIYQFVSRPVSTAVPGIIKAIIEAIEMWEPRVQVQTVTHSLDTTDNKSQLKFPITYKLTDDDLIDTITYTLGQGTDAEAGTGHIILQAIIPAAPGGSKYFLSFIGNGNPVFPNFPSAGFASVYDLYNWVVANWAAYGTWYLANDKIILYLKSGVFQTASLDAYTTINYAFAAAIPDKEIEEYYGVVFTFNGNLATPLFPAYEVYTAGEILTWVNNNWGDYGTWSIEGNNLVLTTQGQATITLSVDKYSIGGFSLGFSNGFNA